MPQIHVRPATVQQGDDVRLVEFYNSQVPWLKTVGSGAQWTTEAAIDGQSSQHQRVKKWVTLSEENTRLDRPFGKEWCRAYIAEVEVSDTTSLSTEQASLCRDGRLPVCGMVLTGRASEYTQRVFSEQDEGDPFVFLQLLVADRRAGPLGRGTGAAMIEYAKVEIRTLGVRRFVGDCFGGNGRRLIKFYESCGFDVVAEYTEKDWPVCCISQRL